MPIFFSDWTGTESLITLDFLGDKSPEREPNGQYLQHDMVRKTDEIYVKIYKVHEHIVNHTSCEQSESDSDEAALDAVDTIVTVIWNFQYVCNYK